MADPSLQDIMTAKLNASFQPSVLEIINESAKHQGHSGHQGGALAAPRAGESHFRVKLVCAAFAGMSRAERHRAVYHALAAELRGALHALALELRAPGE